MNRIKQLLLFVFLIIGRQSFACESKNVAFLKIDAKEYANKTLRINTPYFTDSILLNGDGIGSKKFNIPNHVFAFLTISKNDTTFSKIILIGNGYDLKVKVIGDKAEFSGKGKESNDVITACDSYSEKTFSEINTFIDKTNSIDSIIDYFNNKDVEFDRFYNDLIHGVSLNKSEESLIKNNFIARNFSKKQDFETTYFTFEEADSIKIDQKFGFTNSKLFTDSALIKSGSGDLMNFLSWNFDFRLKHDLNFQLLGQKKYPLAVDSLISSDKTYGWRIKEYLYYHNISSSIYHFGVTNEVEILLSKLKGNYPDSRYLRAINKLVDKYDQLAVGKVAPDFTMENREGATAKLSDWKGKVVFIDVWATWCAPCLKKMPTILKYQEEFENIHFVFLSIDNDKNRWNSFLSDHAEYHKSYIAGKSNFESLYRISSIPRYILIDTNGTIINAFTPNDEAIIHDTLLKYSK